HRLAGSRHAHAVTAVFHGRGPTDHHFVVRAEGILDHDVDIGKCRPDPFYEQHKLIRPVNVSLWGVASGDSVRSKQLVHGLNLVLVPDFEKPAFKQPDILLNRHGDRSCVNSPSAAPHGISISAALQAGFWVVWIRWRPIWVAPG